MTKRFAYSLERVLSLKRQEKRLAESEQFQARQRLDQARQQLHAWVQELSAATAVLEQRLGTLVPANAYLGQQSIVQAIQREIEDAQQYVAKAERAWQEANERLTQVAVQVETLQTHRSDKLQEHHQALQAAEQNQMDEFAMRKWSTGG
jgi:flagellar FliJ protein